MNRLASRVRQLEQRRPDPKRPWFIPLPTDGMTSKEIEEELARHRARGPLTEEEWVAKFLRERVQAGEVVNIGQSQIG